jgi:hypothetical protein
MKFQALLIAYVFATANAFSAVAPKKAATPATNIDRTMKGVDESTDFDPTAGDNAALTRNNKGEVWVSQVRIDFVKKQKGAEKSSSHSMESLVDWVLSSKSGHVLGATANLPRFDKWFEKTLLHLPTLSIHSLFTMKISTNRSHPCRDVNVTLWTPCCGKSVKPLNSA